MRYLTVRAYLTFAVSILGLACANTPGPFCLSGVTTYVEGAKGITREKSLYGDGRYADAARGRARGAEVRVGVALEWDPNRGACELEKE